MIACTERSPLLPHSQLHDENDKNESPELAPLRFPVHVLGELIGVRHLKARNKTSGSTKRVTEPYCVVQYGSKILHRSNTLSRDGIWTIKERPLFLVPVTENDVLNNKTMTLAIWKKPSKSKRSQDSKAMIFLGKVQIKSVDMFDLCNEERVELELVDELGRIVQSTSTISEGSTTEIEETDSPTVALRFRLASQADIRFVNCWNDATSSAATTTISRTVLNGADVLPEENRERAVLVTELEEWEVEGATFRSAVTSTLRSSPRRRQHVFRIKPCPDPSEPTTTKEQLVSRDQLKAITQQPSRQWVEAGSGTLGQLYLEILSCSQLPNVDYGTAVGNQTDAFVAAVYGDSMVQTGIIDDELSPHWPPWTQRAFCFLIMHPSQVLYLGVFGHKRGIFDHSAIGRVEVNLVNMQHDTEYNLEYDLFAACHVSNRESAGKIRIRLRMQLFDERAALLAALRPCPPIYISARKKKSLHVARFTASGEYDNPESFSLKVLLAYIDEITKGFLQRLLYAFGDGVQSLVFWRDQVQVGSIYLPLHSLIVFIATSMVVEYPNFIPAFVFLGAGYLMLVNMTIRVQSPSPWYRCRSFWHYFCVLVFGKSFSNIGKIEPEFGWKEQHSRIEAWRKRAEDNERFFHKKEAVEKEIEASKISIQSESKAAIISLELLVILGKIQGIVGTFVRLGRAVDCIVTWEESSVAFWVTTMLFLVGLFFLFVPWVFLIKWTSRIAVVLFLGPQNKFVDLYLQRKESDESKLRQLYEERRFRARCRQEEDSKLKSFRHVIFGRYGSVVPDIKWSPHVDRPCPRSEASLVQTPVPGCEQLATHGGPCIPGQKLHGLMIPRPYSQWLANSSESKAIKQQVSEAVSKLKLISPQRHTVFLQSPSSEETDSMEEEGVEVSDVLDIEADFAATARRFVKREESLKGDWGVEAVDINETENMFLQKAFEHPSSDTSEGPKCDMLSIASSEDSMDKQLPDGFCDQIRANGSRRLQLIQAQPGKSQRELGIEVQSEMLEDDDDDDNSLLTEDQPLPAISNDHFGSSLPEGVVVRQAQSRKSTRQLSKNVRSDCPPLLTDVGDQVAESPRLHFIQTQRGMGVELRSGTSNDMEDDKPSATAEDESIEDIEAVDSDSISNVVTMEAEAGASRRELGIEIVPFDDDR